MENLTTVNEHRTQLLKAVHACVLSESDDMLPSPGTGVEKRMER
jgi:hypothetical protein